MGATPSISAASVQKMRPQPAPGNATSGGMVVQIPTSRVRERARRDAAELLRLAFPHMSIASAAICAELETGGEVSARTWERVGARRRDTYGHELRILAALALKSGAPHATVVKLMGAPE